MKLALTLNQFGITNACENTVLIERLRNGCLRCARAVMVDFDSTLALVRAGWIPITLDTKASKSDEPDCLRVDAKKRGWLDEGAHYIIPNYLHPGLIAVVLGTS